MDPERYAYNIQSVEQHCIIPDRVAQPCVPSNGGHFT